MYVDPKDERILALETALGEARNYLAKLQHVPVTLAMIRRIDEVMERSTYVPMVKMTGELRGNAGTTVIMNLQVIGDTAYVQSQVPYAKANRLWEVMRDGFKIKLKRQDGLDVTALGDIGNIKIAESKDPVSVAMRELRDQEKGE